MYRMSREGGTVTQGGGSFLEQCKLELCNTNIGVMFITAETFRRICTIENSIHILKCKSVKTTNQCMNLHGVSNQVLIYCDFSVVDSFDTQPQSILTGFAKKSPMVHDPIYSSVMIMYTSTIQSIYFDTCFLKNKISNT